MLLALLSLLAVGGLAVNAGAIPIARVLELAADPPDALILVGNPGRGDVLAAVRRIRNDSPSTRIVAPSGPPVTRTLVRPTRSRSADRRARASDWCSSFGSARSR